MFLKTCHSELYRDLTNFAREVYLLIYIFKININTPRTQAWI